jgi:hypothetical protein
MKHKSNLRTIINDRYRAKLIKRGLKTHCFLLPEHLVDSVRDFIARHGHKETVL